jgi:hypothetical protein
MLWDDVRAAYPDQWLVIEALVARTEDHRRIFEQIAVVEVCRDGEAALRRYRELHHAHPERELYFVHTGSPVLEVEERPWVGIRWNDAPPPP